jgi:hypothetical protein
MPVKGPKEAETQFESRYLELVWRLWKGVIALGGQSMCSLNHLQSKEGMQEKCVLKSKVRTKNLRPFQVNARAKSISTQVILVKRKVEAPTFLDLRTTLQWGQGLIYLGHLQHR